MEVLTREIPKAVAHTTLILNQGRTVAQVERGLTDETGATWWSAMWPTRYWAREAMEQGLRVKGLHLPKGLSLHLAMRDESEASYDHLHRQRMVNTLREFDPAIRVAQVREEDNNGPALIWERSIETLSGGRGFGLSASQPLTEATLSDILKITGTAAVRAVGQLAVTILEHSQSQATGEA